MKLSNGLFSFSKLPDIVVFRFAMLHLWASRAKYLNDVELVDLAVSGEQRLPVHQLAHDTPDRPQVDRRVVPS